MVTREPGEGSSDDLDESADLALKKLRHRQLNQTYLSSEDKQTSSQSHSGIPISQSRTTKHASTAPHRSGIPIRDKQPSYSSLKKQSQVKNSQSPSPMQTRRSCKEKEAKRFSGIVKAKEVKVIEAEEEDDEEEEEELSSNMFRITRQPNKVCLKVKI